MRSRRAGLLVLFGVVVTLVSPTASLATAAPADGDPTDICAELARARSDSVSEVAIVEDAAALPAYCRVVGTLSTSIAYEVRLPTTTWNGKFYMTGCGGFCGNVNADACNAALARGYAIAATDGGHTGSPIDGSWGLDDRKAEGDWAFRAVHRVAGHSKQLIRDFYGEGPAYSYFSGCSGGGREALVSAQRFPNDFDGIIAGAPAHTQAYLAGVSQTWTELAQFDDAGNRVLGVDKLGLIGAAVYERCDGIDGLVDGQIDDPRACDFEPASLLCQPGDEPATCLGTGEVAALEKIYHGPTDSAGNALYSGGMPVGSEELWAFLSVGFGDNLSIGGGFAQEYHRYLAYPTDPGDSFSLFDFDFDTDVAKLAPMANLYNATDPNLRAFDADGGKLLIYHGYADQLITPYGTIDYYEDVVDTMGGLAPTQGFARLFMLPGMGHCGGGPGPNVIDLLTPLEDWVEKGQAPDQVIASRLAADGSTDRTRPVYPYPTVARYDGSGSTDNSSNFVAVNP